MSISLSKKNGTQIFRVLNGRDKGKKFKLDLEYQGEKPITKYQTSGQIQQIPPKIERFCQFIFGASGSGKSYYASRLIKEYKKIHPTNGIYLISPKEEDSVLDELNINRIAINYDNFLSDEKLDDLNECKNALFLFDDCEAISDKKLRDAVDAFRNKLLLQGRSYKSSVIVILHVGMAGNSTKIPLLESQFFTVFPNSGSNTQITNLLQTYAGMSKNQIDKVLKLPSRSVTIHKQYPLYVLSEHEFYLIQ